MKRRMLLAIAALAAGTLVGKIIADAERERKPQHRAEGADHKAPTADSGSRQHCARKPAREPRNPWRRRARTVVATFIVLGLMGSFVAVSGVVPIKASSGHWPITRWFLNFSMARSVSLHSRGIEVPPLDHPGLALKAAGHYATGCAPCHGSPSRPVPRIATHMTVQPPFMPDVLSQWQDRELFYIVKHGVKFTGMPAWPAQGRDDEVWAMVAFLRALPEMEPAQYHKATGNDAVEVFGTAEIKELEGREALPPAIVSMSCVRCHGEDGLGRGQAELPILAGQRPGYLRAALDAYAVGERHSGIMEPVAYGLSSEEIAAVVEHYANLTDPRGPTPSADAAAIARGRDIAHRGIPAQRVPSCIDCHAPEGEDYRPEYPSLSGQPADYLVLQLRLFQKGDRGGSEYAHLMRRVAAGLNPGQMRDAAAYFESLARSPSEAQP